MMAGWGFGVGFWSPFFLIILVWSLYWKGLALWKSARAGSRNWFIALLLIQTIGILDILYIYAFSKPKAPRVNDH